MEVIAILLFVTLIIIILSFRNRTMERIEQLQKEILRLREEVREGLKERPATSPKNRSNEERVKEEPVVKTGPVQEESIKETEPFIALYIKPEFTPSPEVSKPHEFKPSTSTLPPPPPPPPPKPGFFERHPDLEKFIGENLVSKIGIGVLVLAIGFFVKYAIDNDWIGPVGRVGIGLLCGGILVGIAHVLRVNYKAFSSVLVGGGLAIFYFSIALAYHEYQLFSQSLSFIFMLVITAFAVILSLLYDRQELAIIALVGGFVTPFLVSNGSGDYKVLFSYLLILNVGLLVIAYRKAWRLLNLLAFGFTVILFASWLITLPSAQSILSTYQGAFLFATTFFILFFAINIAHNIRENRKFIASDFGILLANTCLYFGAGYYLLSEMDLDKYDGLFSACMAVFNLVSSYFLFRTKKVDSNVLYLLIGITLTFISLTAPLQLHGHYITLFWASESVLLYWLSRKSGLRIIAVASLLIWGAMLISLVMDWTAVYGITRNQLPVIFNKGLMTTLYAAVCCYINFLLRKKESVASNRITDIAMLVVALLLLFAGGALEIVHQFEYYYPGTDLSTLYLVLYGFIWASSIIYTGGRRRWLGDSTSYATILIVLCVFVYIGMIQESYTIQTNLLLHGNHAHFLAHWASALLVAVLIYRSISWWRKGKLQPAVAPAAFSWMVCSLIILFLSAEVQLLVDFLFYSKSLSFSRIDTVYFKTGLPILWGLSSFVFMWLGMRFKFKPIRIISLVLFSVTLLKLFLWDIRNIPVAGKIAAFFCLGVILLVVSFMYQRLKKIIIEDEEKKSI